jgi:hypothetical protein
MVAFTSAANYDLIFVPGYIPEVIDSEGQKKPGICP